MSEDRLKILLEVGLGSGIGELQKLETSLKNLDTYSTSAQAGLKKITDVDFGRLSSQIDSVAGGMQKIGTAMSLIGVPMGLIAKESINMYADLESQIQRNTALLGGGKAEYEQILALSKELGASSPFDALEIGAGIEALAAAGYSLQDIQAAMPTITNMAVATGEDLNSMSEILIATLNSYGESADMAGVYGDKLATIANISSASITDFGESMKYVGGIADAFGVDIDELGAVIGALADVNIKGSMAGTGLRSIITDLANPTGKIEKIFASFGLTMDDLNPKVVDFVEILQKMKDAGVSDEALMAAFGDRGGVVAVNMLSQLDKIKENYNTLQNESAGMLEDFAAQMRDTLKFVMDEMGGTIANIMIEIGEGLKPIVQEMGAWLNENQGTLVEFAKNAVEGLTPFVEKFMDLSAKLMEWFNSLPDDMQSKVAGLTGLGSAMATIGGPLLLLGSLPVSALGKISGGIDKIKKSVMGSQAAATELMILTDAINALAAAQVASVVDVTPGGDKNSKRSATKGITAMADETLVAADVLGDAGSTFLLAGDRYEKDVDAAKKRIKTAQEWDHEFFNYDTDNLLGSQKSTVNLKRGATEIADSFDFVDAALTGSILGSEVSSVNFKRNAKEVVDSVDEVADGLKAKKIDISDSLDIIGDAFSLDSLSKQGTVKKAVKELADDLDEIPSRFSKIADPFKNVGETVAASVSKFSSSTKTALSTAKTEMLLLGSTAATELTAMLSTLPGIGVAIAGAAAIGIAAYMTNFGDFRDNVNDIMAEIGSAVNNINTGNYEAAGRDCAQAFANGLESVADLAVAAITSIPDAVKAFDEMSRGFDAALSEISVGFGQGLRNIVDEGVASFSSALSSASVDVSSFVSGIITQITSQDWSSPGDAIGNLIGAGINGSTPSISGFIDGIASQLTSFDWEGLLSKTLLSVSLPGLGPVGSGVVGDVLSGFINPKSGNGSTGTQSLSDISIERLKKELIDSGVTPHAAEQQATTQYYQNRAAHSGGYLNSGEVTTATETGTKDGMVNAAPEVAQQTGKSVAEALAKEKGWYDKGQLDVQMAENFLAKNPAFAEQYSAKLKESSESTDKNTKGQEDLAQSFKSLDDAIAHIMTTDKSSFVYDGKKYGREQNDDGSYSWQDQSNAAKEQRNILEKQQKEAEKTSKNTGELGLQFQRGVSVQEAMLSAIQQYGGLNKAEGQKFTVGEDTYKIAIDSSGKIIAQAVSATAKVAQGQQKVYDDLIKKQSDLNDKLIKKQGKLATKEIGSTEYKNLQTDINNLKNEIRLNKAEIDAQTKIVKDNTGTTTKLDAEQLKLIDSVDSTSKGIFEFSEPVKIAGESTNNLADGSNNATGALQTFADTLGSLDIKSIIQGWLGEGELGEAQQRKANDLGALYGEDVSDRLTNGLATTISKELPKWVSWQKEGKGQSYDDVSKYKSDLWYEFANAVLKSNYAGYRDLGTRDWTFRQDVDSKLNPDTLKMTDELFRKAVETYVKPFYDGTLKAEPGKDWLGNSDIKNNSPYYSNDWKFVNEGLKETGTEAKTTTPQINTLNSALEKIGLTGSGLTNVLSNVNQSLSDHHANIQESQDYLKQYNEAAGENVKYSKEQVGLTTDLMNSLGTLGTAQNMYNQYISDGVLDATESAHVQEALAAATKMMGDAGITAEGGISGLPGALQALASAAQAAMSQIQAAIAMANAQITNVRKVGDWTLQTMSGLPTIAPSSPTNFKFASGGPVTQNGPAMLHQGEYVLRRDEVTKLTSGSPNVNLNINMSNSRFGNSEMQKDLPKRIARETRRALARSGI